MCGPSANTENSPRTREKPLVPRVFRGRREEKWGSFRGRFGDHFRVGEHFGVGIISGAVHIRFFRLWSAVRRLIYHFQFSVCLNLSPFSFQQFLCIKYTPRLKSKNLCQVNLISKKYILAYSSQTLALLTFMETAV